MDDLFSAAGECAALLERPRPAESLAEGAVWLPGFVLREAAALVEAIGTVVAQAPFRHFRTRGGDMSAAMSSCGACGWTASPSGYFYTRADPDSGRPWPEMPPLLRGIAVRAAAAAGYADFDPISCLINRYAPGAGMGLHQDRDEGQAGAPVVSVSLGVSARFSFGGNQRSDPKRVIVLRHGDVVVWGGASRFAWHGVGRLRETFHPLTGGMRYNLTFRSVNGAVFRP